MRPEKTPEKAADLMDRCYGKLAGLSSVLSGQVRESASSVALLTDYRLLNLRGRK
jgi:hypothetical protein